MKLLSLLYLSSMLLFAQSKALDGIRQLTHGGQNAEAYWSPDGKRLIFQSTRPGYACDQIFTMDADGSNQKLVSTGKGRTTCGYFLKDGKHIVYASTHETDSACPKEPDRSKGYVWPVFAGYEIYLATDDGRIAHLRLTPEGERRLADSFTSNAAERTALREAFAHLDVVA